MAKVSPQQAGEWFQAYGAALVLYARQWLGPAAAEDVVQEVFIRLMGLGEPPRQVQAWLFAAARNAAISHMRSSGRRHRYEQAHPAGRRAWFESQPEDKIDAAAAQAALEALPAEQREVIVLRIWAGLTLQEISNVTGQPVSTLFSRYQAGLAAVRKQMEPSSCAKTKD